MAFYLDDVIDRVGCSLLVAFYLDDVIDRVGELTPSGFLFR